MRQRFSPSRPTYHSTPELNERQFSRSAKNFAVSRRPVARSSNVMSALTASWMTSPSSRRARVDADTGDDCLLAGLGVLAGGLAHRLRRCGDVEDVVSELEDAAGGFGVGGEQRQLLVRRAAEKGAEADRGADQGAGLHGLHLGDGAG